MKGTRKGNSEDHWILCPLCKCCLDAWMQIKMCSSCHKKRNPKMKASREENYDGNVAILLNCIGENFIWSVHNFFCNFSPQLLPLRQAFAVSNEKKKINTFLRMIKGRLPGICICQYHNDWIHFNFVFQIVVSGFFYYYSTLSRTYTHSYTENTGLLTVWTRFLILKQ